MLVVLATMVVTSVMLKIAMTYLVTRRWNVTNASIRIAVNTICLVSVADFWFY